MSFRAPQKSAPSTFSSAPSAFNSNSRTFNVYGQDAEAFGSAIGQSIGQRIQQVCLMLILKVESRISQSISLLPWAALLFSPTLSKLNWMLLSNWDVRFMPSLVWSRKAALPFAGTSTIQWNTVLGNKQDTSPTYDVQFTPPSSPSSSPDATSYTSMTPSTSSYGSSSTYQSTYPTSSATWPSTHPPEDLPTVQQAYQAQQASYGSTPSIPQIPQSLTGNSNGFGGLPGLLPPPQNSDCPWCSQNGGYRGKRIPSEEKEQKKEEKI
ncbi:Protein CBG22254 [Caenorhabditis briggsae]|uniref:Protein CBG22254 n=1 Tax=Caenorhabditis briggsae TaxID=6238 RepID=A8Y1W8_CAEBR|nr:Protein CBG22254 [Caenorhabditis briggsae]CAP38888.2 Protein CBG22254 [Caenorhabditis briggsae]